MCAMYGHFFYRVERRQNIYKRNLMDLVGLLDNVRLERHPDLLIKAIVVHVDVDDGDILVAGFAVKLK